MNKPAWRYYGRFYRGSYRKLIFAIVVSILMSMSVLPIAYLLRQAFDKVIPSGDIRLLLAIGALILLLSALNGVIALWTSYVTLGITKSAIQQFRSELIKKVYTFSRKFYSTADRRKLHTSIVQDSERLDYLSNALLTQALPAVAVGVALCGALIYINWILFLVMASVAPFFYLVSRKVGKKVRQNVQAFHRSFEKFSGGMTFVLQALDLTKVQSAEQLEIARQSKTLDELRTTGSSMAWLYAVYHTVQNTIATSSGILVLIAGGVAIASGTMTLGELISFYVIVGMVRQQVNTISYTVPGIIAGNESLDTLYGIICINDPNPYSGRKQIAFRGKIALEHVRFRYEEQPLLEDINLVLEPGGSVAIVGPNGAGKSTIINLILGFYRPQEGHLFADDCPFSEVDIIRLRRSMGVVMQDPIIFPGTILDNITYGYPAKDMAEIVRACERATAHEFIKELPGGYETFVGESGVLLSGGQRQRIAIARAILASPRLLILDEPTNHLDVGTVRRLMANIKSMEGSPSVLLISHDRTVVQEAQRAFLLQEGRLTPTSSLSPVEPGAVKIDVVR